MEKPDCQWTGATDGYQLVVEGVEQSLPCSAAKTVLQALSDGEIFVEANCGGRGVCGKCKIQVIHGAVTGLDHKPAKQLQPNIYLACQIRPEENLFARLKRAEVSTKGNIAEKFAIEGQPVLEKKVLTPDSYMVGQPFSLCEMVDRLLPTATPVSDELRRRLVQAMETAPQQLTVVMVNNEPIIIEAGDTSQALFGLAFDIGTTTVVGMLIDFNERKVIAICSETNPQAAFGADVVSRITATEKPGNLGAQARAIRQCLNRIIQELCDSTKVLPNEIYALSIAGNSTMEHLLMEVSPLCLVRKPYSACFQYIKPFSPRECGLNINCDGKVLLLPNTTGFIGADTIAAVIAVDQDISPELFLIVDLGTNGEMTLGNSEKIFACSTAAGSAFEGAHIRDGMRASTGAITDVSIDDEVRVKTIGGGKPLGICGVGVVKAIAELLKQKIITSSGRFNQEFGGIPLSLKGRLKYNNDQWEFVLVDAADSANGYDISITQADIRKIQLAKSAICSGIQILLEKEKTIDKMPVLLAGAFGNYIDIESAIVIGMLPGFNREQVRSIGNAAGIGAVHTLLSKEKLARCIRISSQIECIELAAHPDFSKKFLANLAFPEVL